MEVIIVDDGSSDNTSSIQQTDYPFSFRYLKQSNQGDAIARNLGAQESKGSLLVFLDDDIQITPDCLQSMQSVYGGEEGVIVVGTFLSINPLSQPENFAVVQTINEKVQVPFSECKSGLMAIARKDFFRLGMMQPLKIKGSSIWCDVELAYRAYLINFTFLKSSNAIGFHDDYTEYNLTAKSRRMYRAAKESILLFQRHPHLQKHLPMFHDKTPIDWRKDHPKLIVRKMVRALASIGITLKLLELAYKTFTVSKNLFSVCAVIERWIIGGYIYCGYRRGLKEYGWISLDGQTTSTLKA